MQPSGRAPVQRAGKVSQHGRNIYLTLSAFHRCDTPPLVLSSSFFVT